MATIHHTAQTSTSNTFVKDSQNAVNSLGGADLTAAEEGSKFVENAVRYQREFGLIGEVVKASHNHSPGSVVYMRYINLLCRICTFGEDEFKACEEAGAIKDIIVQCMTNDILVQINVISLLTDVGSTMGGLDFLCNKGVFDWLIFTSCGIMVESADDITNSDKMVIEEMRADPMIQIEALRVLGLLFVKAANLNYNIFDRLHHTFILHFLRTVHRYLEEGSEEERLTGIIE